jgi:rod shape-determining protein MreC
METTPRFFRHGPGLLARLVFFVMLSLILMALDTRFGYLPEIRQTVAMVAYPLQKLAYLPSVLSSRLDSGVFVSQNLVDEIATLKQQHLVDRGSLQRLQALEAENAQLRKLLNATKQLENGFVLAEILSIPPDPFSRKAILDKGSQNHIQPGQVVVDDTGVVGQITRVYPLLSEITLITDKDHSVPVQSLRNGLRSVVSGTGASGVLELRYLATNADIQRGDVLVTSGIDGVYPPGLPVAQISEIRSNATDAFARITCVPAAGVDRNRQVLILSLLPPAPAIPAEPAVAARVTPVEKRRGKIGIH